jgi:phospholipid/cholesterol/gamma-HCH transport system permease protein
MVKFKPVIKVIPKVRDATKHSMERLSDKTLEKTDMISNFLTDVADVTLFITRLIKNLFSRDFEWKEFFRQCYHIGYKTLPLISITGAIMGLVLTIQSRPVLVDFGADSMLPGMVAISLIREMGPVVTEQIEAMEVSSTNPMRFLVVTRVLAATLMIPLLILYADLLGILGSWGGANIKGDVSFTLFFSQAFSHIDFIDFIPAVIKSFFFGAVIGLVGCYKGYNAGRGTESVGIAANSAVVLASLLVIITDMIAVQITDMLIS